MPFIYIYITLYFILKLHLLLISVIKTKEYSLLIIVQEMCESRGVRPGVSVLTSLLVSVDIKLY